MCLEDLDPAYLTSVVTMGATTGFHICPSNVHHSQLVPRHDPSLVQPEPELLLSLRLVHHILSNLLVFQHDFIGSVLYLLLLFFGERVEMSDI